MAINVARRKFISALGGATVAWPLAVRAQQADQVRRVGVLMNLAADDPEGKPRVAAFLQGLQELGWTDGRNMRIDYRWAANDADRYRTYAAELLALAPDVILANGSQSVAALLQTTRTVPIVFVNVVDPVGAGFVPSLARPGGNATGFTAFEYSMREIAGAACAGTSPPWSTTIRSTPVLFFLSSAREMAAALCPFFHRPHSSAFCAAVNQILDVTVAHLLTS